MAMEWKTKRRVVDLSQRAVVMGILNATPDSFSDGGRHAGGHSALEHALEMVQQGAGIIDVGGESTRPGADAVSEATEMARVIPVIEQLRQQSDVLISIDTTKAVVAEAALVAGADIVNDVSGLRADPEMIDVCARHQAGIIAMHSQGSPKTMQLSPHYEDVVAEVLEFFQTRVEVLGAAGVEPGFLCVDPGIGFGKSVEHNIALLHALEKLQRTGLPMLLGVSRKSFIGATLGLDEPLERDAATVALTVQARLAGCMLHRVHAVEPNVQALKIVEEVMLYGG